MTLDGTFSQLREFHRRAPFLFFNGNTFATIGRELALALFSDLPPIRKREIASVVGHYIAGVLDHKSMASLVDGLCEVTSFKPGDRVRTTRGSLSGVVLHVLEDGRVVWQPDGSTTELTATPESLLVEKTG